MACPTEVTVSAVPSQAAVLAATAAWRLRDHTPRGSTCAGIAAPGAPVTLQSAFRYVGPRVGDLLKRVREGLGACVKHESLYWLVLNGTRLAYRLCCTLLTYLNTRALSSTRDMMM